MTRLQVLLVEDEPDDLHQFVRDFPIVFSSRNIEVNIHPCSNFDDAFAKTSDPLYRYDLIVSDTYRGPAQHRDAQVLQMINNYRGTRFCPLVIYSSGVKPPELEEGAFVVWANKGQRGDIERAIEQLLNTNIPQLARKLHDELEQSTGAYLWTFLEKKWTQLNHEPLDPGVLERLVRRRAAIQIGDMDPESDMVALLERQAPEYYIYPAFMQAHYNLGDVLRSKQDGTDWRVILTPHCHLFKQQNHAIPRAEYVLLVKAVLAELVLGEKLENAKADEAPKRNKKLAQWSRSPAQTDRLPEGRHWHLPRFLDIPHLFCDFLQVQSVKYESLEQGFERVATLLPPYAEALQSCFGAFYAAIGIPTLRPESVENIFA